MSTGMQERQLTYSPVSGVNCASNRNPKVDLVGENYSEAAYRHFDDSDHLAKMSSWGNASHLIGFAAECAVKYRIKTLRPAAGAPHGHFPDLLDIARKHLRNRRDTTMHSVLKQSKLMDGWHVSLRYGENNAVGQAKYKEWRKDAARLLSAAGLKR